MEDIRLWRGNVGVRKAFGYKGIVPFYIRNEDLNALAQKHPENYLAMLDLWLELLKNQLFYSAEGRTAWIVCSNAVDGKIATACFECELEEDRIRILSVGKAIPEKEWKSLKWMGRK